MGVAGCHIVSQPRIRENRRWLQLPHAPGRLLDVAII
jgi:hypothetical protein